MNRLPLLRIAWLISMVTTLYGLAGWRMALAESEEERSFRELETHKWREMFFDPCTGDWKKKWFLDGDDAVVSAGRNGMTIDASDGYAVLWTKRSFEGDIRIEYDFKRLDGQNKGVNILYIQATGDGEDGHDEDITKWSQERADAAMSDYFNNMHTYHISYAAYGWNDGVEYVRARRYLPLAGRGLKGTELAGTYERTGLFDEPGRWIRVKVFKTPVDLLVRFVGPDKTLICHFKNEDKLPIERGRLGLRLMPGRRSLIRNFRVWSRGDAPESSESGETRPSPTGDPGSHSLKARWPVRLEKGVHQALEHGIGFSELSSTGLELSLPRNSSRVMIYGKISAN